MSTTLEKLISNLSERGECSTLFDLRSEAAINRVIKSDQQKLKRLGKDFLIPKDDELPPNLKDIKFNSFLAEPLLREGSLLLDRCLQERREHDELKTKFFEACIQLDELIRLNEITAKEEADYHLSKDIADAESKAVQVESEHRKDGSSLVNALTTLKGKTNDPYLIQRVVVEAEENVLQRNVNSRKQTAADAIVTQKQKLETYQKERNDVARLVALRRAVQLENPDGALNFGKQMKPIKDRFDNDLMAAYLRLSAANDGFSKLYQYPISFPKLTDKRELDFDELVTWCQNTNTWLASFLDTQQQVTRSFSLAQLISERKFKDGLAKGRWQFKLNEEHIHNSKFVRLRGFAIQIDSGNERGSWNIAITPPTKAKLRNEKEVQDLDQNVGRLYLGRVNETTYQVIPESAAPPKLYNASPIGQDIDGSEWTIEILGMSTDKIPASAINDIDIHLTVALV